MVTKVNADVVQILKSPEAQAFFREQGAEAMVTTPEAFQALLESDIAKWGRVVTASGARLD